jgi:hypothetical protein
MEDVGIFYGYLVNFMVFCYIVCAFGIVLGNLVYFSLFGTLYHEESGNPARNHFFLCSTLNKKSLWKFFMAFQVAFCLLLSNFYGEFCFIDCFLLNVVMLPVSLPVKVFSAFLQHLKIKFLKVQCRRHFFEK